jgi:hypothetical protein
MVSLNMRTRAVGLDRWELSAPTARVSIAVLKWLSKDDFLAIQAIQPFKRDFFYSQYANKFLHVFSLRNRSIFCPFYGGIPLSVALSKHLIMSLAVFGSLAIQMPIIYCLFFFMLAINTQQQYNCN